MEFIKLYVGATLYIIYSFFELIYKETLYIYNLFK
jgi:hypothetical protein